MTVPAYLPVIPSDDTLLNHIYHSLRSDSGKRLMLNIGFLLDVEVKYVCLKSLRKLLLKELNAQILEVNPLALLFIIEFS